MHPRARRQLGQAWRAISMLACHSGSLAAQELGCGRDEQAWRSPSSHPTTTTWHMPVASPDMSRDHAPSMWRTSLHPWPYLILGLISLARELLHLFLCHLLSYLFLRIRHSVLKQWQTCIFSNGLPFPSHTPSAVLVFYGSVRTHPKDTNQNVHL